MELSSACVRDTLLYLEEHTGIFQNESKKMEYFTVGGKQLMDALSSDGEYEPDMIFYAALQLYHAGMIKGEIKNGSKAVP